MPLRSGRRQPAPRLALLNFWSGSAVSCFPFSAVHTTYPTTRFSLSVGSRRLTSTPNTLEFSTQTKGTACSECSEDRKILHFRRLFFEEAVAGWSRSLQCPGGAGFVIKKKVLISSNKCFLLKNSLQTFVQNLNSLKLTIFQRRVLHFANRLEPASYNSSHEI